MSSPGQKAYLLFSKHTQWSNKRYHFFLNQNFTSSYIKSINTIYCHLLFQFLMTWNARGRPAECTVFSANTFYWVSNYTEPPEMHFLSPSLIKFKLANATISPSKGLELVTSSYYGDEIQLPILIQNFFGSVGNTLME